MFGFHFSTKFPFIHRDAEIKYDSLDQMYPEDIAEREKLLRPNVHQPRIDIAKAFVGIKNLTASELVAHFQKLSAPGVTVTATEIYATKAEIVTREVALTEYLQYLDAMDDNAIKHLRRSALLEDRIENYWMVQFYDLILDQRQGEPIHPYRVSYNNVAEIPPFNKVTSYPLSKDLLNHHRGISDRFSPPNKASLTHAPRYPMPLINDGRGAPPTPLYNKTAHSTLTEKCRASNPSPSSTTGSVDIPTAVLWAHTFSTPPVSHGPSNDHTESSHRCSNNDNTSTPSSWSNDSSGGDCGGSSSGSFD